MLSLNQEDLLNVSSGWIINLVAGDLQRFELSAHSFVDLAEAVLEVTGISCLMMYLFGWKPLSGVGFMVILAMYYAVTGQISLKLRTKISHVADLRVDMMNSILSGIRSVKMYAWEGSFMEKVKRLRRYVNAQLLLSNKLFQTHQIQARTARESFCCIDVKNRTK